MKTDVYFIVKPNSITNKAEIISGPYYRWDDAYDIKVKEDPYRYQDYRIAMTELELDLM